VPGLLVRILFPLFFIRRARKSASIKSHHPSRVEEDVTHKTRRTPPMAATTKGTFGPSLSLALLCASFLFGFHSWCVLLYPYQNCVLLVKKRVHRIIFHLTQELEKQTTKMNEKLKMKIV
jgi:hypothetical protein